MKTGRFPREPPDEPSRLHGWAESQRVLRRLPGCRDRTDPLAIWHFCFQGV